MNKNLTITEEKSNGIRPLIILTEEQKKIVKQMASICTTKQIADYLGIDRKSFIDILNRDNEVSLLYKKGRVEAHIFVVNKLMKQIQNGDLSAINFYLKTQSRWKELKNEEEDIKDNELKIIVEIKEDENIEKKKWLHEKFAEDVKERKLLSKT